VFSICGEFTFIIFTLLSFSPCIMNQYMLLQNKTLVIVTIPFQRKFYDNQPLHFKLKGGRSLSVSFCHCFYLCLSDTRTHAHTHTQNAETYKIARLDWLLKICIFWNVWLCHWASGSRRFWRTIMCTSSVSSSLRANIKKYSHNDTLSHLRTLEFWTSNIVLFS
jgi:hypothetical protein